MERVRPAGPRRAWGPAARPGAPTPRVTWWCSRREKKKKKKKGVMEKRRRWEITQHCNEDFLEMSHTLSLNSDLFQK